MAFTEAEAKAQFETLLDLAEHGEEVVIARNGVGMVQLTPVTEASHPSACNCPICGEPVA